MELQQTHLSYSLKLTISLFDSGDTLESLQDSWCACSGDMLLFWSLPSQMSPLVPPPRDICCLRCREDISRGKSHWGLSPPCPLGPALRQVSGRTGLFPMYAYCQWCKKVAFSFHSGGQHYFQCVIGREKREKEKNLPIASRSPTGPQEQPHYTVVRSEVIQYKVEIKTLFFFFFLRRGEMAVWEEFHQIPEEAVHWEAALFGKEANTHNLVLSHWTHRRWHFW